MIWEEIEHLESLGVVEELAVVAFGKNSIKNGEEIRKKLKERKLIKDGNQEDDGG